MKIIKYGLLAFLVVMMCKKTHTQTVPFTATLPQKKAVMGNYDKTHQTASINFDNVIEVSNATYHPELSSGKYVAFGTTSNPSYNPKTKGLMGAQDKNITLYGIPSGVTSSSPKGLKRYDPKGRMAILNNGDEYVGVVEYSQAVTPPNITNRALVPFATIPNSLFEPTQKPLAGGQMKNITLYGIPVTGDKIEVTQPTTYPVTIGYYWPNDGIIQLFNGGTYVLVQTIAAKNYTKKAEVDLTTLFNTQENQNILKKFSVNIPITGITGYVGTSSIGTVTIKHKKFETYGFMLNNPRPIPMYRFGVHDVGARHMPSPHITKESVIPQQEKPLNDLLMTSPINP